MRTETADRSLRRRVINGGLSGLSGKTSWSVGLGLGRGVVEEDLGDASGLLQGGEVPGVRKRDRSGAW